MLHSIPMPMKMRAAAPGVDSTSRRPSREQNAQTVGARRPSDSPGNDGSGGRLTYTKPVFGRRCVSTSSTDFDELVRVTEVAIARFSREPCALPCRLTRHFIDRDCPTFLPRRRSPSAMSPPRPQERSDKRWTLNTRNARLRIPLGNRAQVELHPRSAQSTEHETRATQRTDNQLGVLASWSSPAVGKLLCSTGSSATKSTRGQP